MRGKGTAPAGGDQDDPPKGAELVERVFRLARSSTHEDVIATLLFLEKQKAKYKLEVEIAKANIEIMDILSSAIALAGTVKNEAGRI